jgi:SAM-dependent methyltransferase
VEAAARAVRDWADARVLDIGCGAGFHLPGFAATARSVIGVEPHADLIRLARYRCRGLRHVTVHQATAQRLPLPDGSVDVVHARWAYFFGPGCEPGLREVERVLAPGGAAILIDHDASIGTFATWFRREHPTYDADRVERFWSSHGFTRTSVATRWRFSRRADLEAVLRIEFSPAVAEPMIAALPGLEIDYAANVWWRRKDVGRLL